MSENKPALAGGVIQALDGASCERLLGWLVGRNQAPPVVPGDLRWALAYCDDGVTWGRLDEQQGVWRLSSDVKPDLSPPVRRERLQQLRLFGPSAEVLIWRDGDGLRGRILKDAADSAWLHEALRPSEENRILLGDHVTETFPAQFTHVGDRAGLHQVLPLAVTPQELKDRRARLKVRHYWEQDPQSGAVRIRATRLVDVFIEDR